MWEMSERVRIEAPAERVWAIVSDVSTHARLAGSGEVETIEDISGPIALGTTWRSRNSIRGAGTFMAQEEIIAFDPPRTIGWRSVPPPIVKKRPDDSLMDIRWRFSVEPDGTGCVVEHAVTIKEPPVGGGRVRLFYAMTRRAHVINRGMRRTLENLRSAAEALEASGAA